MLDSKELRALIDEVIREKEEQKKLKKDFPGAEDGIDWAAAMKAELEKKYEPPTLEELANEIQDTPNYYTIKGIEEFKKEIPVFDNYVEAFEFITKLADEKGVSLDD